MTEIIVNTYDDLEINKIGYGWILNEHMEEIIVSTKVLEEVTYKEYYEFVKKHNLIHLINPSIVTKEILSYRDIRLNMAQPKLLSVKVEEFIQWLEEMTDFGDWDESIRREVQIKLIEIMTQK